MTAKRVLLIVLAVFLLLFGAAFFIKIEDVSVTGNMVNNTPEEIEARIFDCNKYSRHTVYQFVKQLLGKKEEIPFVEDYKIEFESLNKVEVIVYEKSIVGYITYMNSLMYFDKDGIIVDSSSEHIDGIPEITGLKFGSIVLYRKLPVEDERIFDEILTITQSLQTFGVDAQRISFSEMRDVTLYLGDITVELGSGGNYDSKVAELSDMLPNIRSRMREESIESGTLYLDSYDENMIGNNAYTFKKN